ncbi:MAG: DUF6703 family protein [Actinomycetes bacterium]
MVACTDFEGAPHVSKNRRSRRPVRRPGTARQPGSAAGPGPHPADQHPPQRRAADSGGPPRRGARAALERSSAPLLLRMSVLPGWLVPVLMLAIAVVALLVGGPVGFALLLVIALFLAWLAALSWPVLPPRTRLLRVLVPLAVLAAAILQL